MRITLGGGTLELTNQAHWRSTSSNERSPAQMKRRTDLAQTAKLKNLSVFKYLRAVLLYMPDYVHEPEGIEELMRWSDKMKKLYAIDTKATIEDKDGNPRISR